MAGRFREKDPAFEPLETLYGQPLAEAEKLEVADGLSAFFRLLNEWQTEDMLHTRTLEEFDNVEQKENAD
jgi:hypothetical protein